jgi:predicted O-methyltransferase YrrM
MSEQVLDFVTPDFPSDISTAVTHAEATALQHLARGGRILELGAQYGFSTIVLATSAGFVHSVDWHRGDSMAGYNDTLRTCVDNVRRCGLSNVAHHVGRFEDLLPLFGREVFDGCFLDGEHDLASVRRDSALAIPLVRPGGWFAWHDYGRPGCRVSDVVDQLVADRRLALERRDYLAWIRLPR